MSLKSSLILSICWVQCFCFAEEPEDPPAVSKEEARQIVKEAYIWGYPVVVMYRTMKLMTNSRAPFNEFWRVNKLIGADFKDVVTPNVDTLYASAWLSLCDHPVLLHTPDTDGRYYGVEFLDIYTNVFRNVGKRTSGTIAKQFIITGPQWRGTLPDGLEHIKAPTNNVWLISRVLVNGEKDVAQAAKLNDAITLSLVNRKFVPVYSKPFFGSPQTVSSAGIEFFDELGDALLGNSPPVLEKELVGRFALVGIGEGKHPSKHTSDPELKEAFDLGIADANKEINENADGLFIFNNGWRYTLKGGKYGQDYLLRAEMAKSFLGANVPQESLYAFGHEDAKGDKLEGSKKYQIHFEKNNLPPVKGFWSLTMYDAKTHLLVSNSLSRYSLGDRSEQMKYNPDGSLDIYIQNNLPEDHEANWLPAPEGYFYLVLRFYIPKSSILDGTYKYPTIEQK